MLAGADPHRFPPVTEIGQTFHNKHIFNNNNNMTFKDGLDKCFLFPGKGNFRDLKSQNITGGACPRAPLEACFLGPSFRTSVSIYPRSAPGLGGIFARHKAVISSFSRYFSMFVVCNWHHKQSEQDNRDAAPLRSVTFC